MSSQKLQVARSIRVIPSDNAVIPFPGSVESGTNTSAAAENKLIDSTATFVTKGIQLGYIVYNTTDQTAATVTNVDSETALSLNANIFSSTSKDYDVYVPPTDDGPVLYVGGGGNLHVVTEGGDDVTFAAVPTGSFFPVHVSKVRGDTTATLINALW